MAVVKVAVIVVLVKVVEVVVVVIFVSLFFFFATAISFEAAELHTAVSKLLLFSSNFSYPMNSAQYFTSRGVWPCKVIPLTCNNSHYSSVKQLIRKFTQM